jgi:hypothetical protein
VGWRDGHKLLLHAIKLTFVIVTVSVLVKCFVWLSRSYVSVYTLFNTASWDSLTSRRRTSIMESDKRYM